MMKKLLALLLALLTVATLAACSKEGGNDGDDLDQYREEEIVYESITVGSSTFYFETLDSDSVAISGYTGPTELHDITIPTEVKISNTDDSTRAVTAIANNAFYAISSLKNVTVPEGITAIGDFAFANCVQLESITLPSSLKELGMGAFLGSALKELGLPTTCALTSLSNMAYSNCQALKNVTIPAYIKTVGDNAFYNCTGIETVVLAEGVEKVGKQAFQNTFALKELTLPTTFQNTNPREDLAFSGSNVLYIENIHVTAGSPAETYAKAMILETAPETND